MLSNTDILRIPDFVTFVTEKGKVRAELCGNTAAAEDMKLIFNVGETVTPVLTAGKSEVKYIYLRWNGKISEDALYLGDAFERGYGRLEWRKAVPHRLMPWYFFITDKNETVGYGVETGADSFAFWTADSHGVTLIIDVRCGGMGVILEGKEVGCAHILSLQSADNESVFDFMHRFCVRMCPSPVFPEKPVYGSNNWYYAYGKSSEAEILSDTKLVAELTDGLENRPFMVIDDCWQPDARKTGAAGRPIDRGNEFFPDMAGLAEKIKKAGVKPGIWFRPMRTGEDENRVPASLRSSRDSEILDISLEPCLEMIGEDVRRLVSWGYELIKYDFPTNDAFGVWGSYDTNFILNVRGDFRWKRTDRTNAQIIKGLYETIYNNAGNTVLIGCNVIGHLAAGYIHIHRSGDDTSGRRWGRTAFMGINTLAFRLCQNNAFFKTDADCVGVTRQVEWEKNRQFLDLVAHSGSPLFCSIAPDAVDEKVKADIKKAFEINSVQKDRLEPVDWFDTAMPEKYILNSAELLEYSFVPECGFTDVEG